MEKYRLSVIENLNNIREYGLEKFMKADNVKW
jgi:hypothetical protein